MKKLHGNVYILFRMQAKANRFAKTAKELLDDNNEENAMAVNLLRYL